MPNKGPEKERPFTGSPVNKPSISVRSNPSRRISAKEQARTRMVLVQALRTTGLSATSIAEITGIPARTVRSIAAKLKRQQGENLYQTTQAKALREEIKALVLQKAREGIDGLTPEKLEAAPYLHVVKGSSELVRLHEFLDQDHEGPMRHYLTAIQRYVIHSGSGGSKTVPEEMPAKKATAFRQCGEVEDYQESRQLEP